jgi:hypothetical protein
MFGPGGYKGISLNAATGVGAGSRLDILVPRAVHTMQVTYTGGPTTVVVDLEGSLNGVDFKQMTRWDTGVPALVSGDMVTASVFAGTGIRAYPAVAFVRANLITLTGGASPTVTAIIGGV